MTDSTQEQAAEPKDDLFAGNVPIRDALHRLRLRLLDLTGRNRLLNFKHGTGKSLQFVQSSPEAVFSRLVETNNGSKVTISPVQEPDRSAWVMKSGRLTKPDAKEHASVLGIDTSYDLALMNRRVPVGANTGSQLKTLYYAEDLGKHCRKIEREARLAIEETGANMLYLVFGFLEYSDTKDSDKLFRAPLVCVPVKMDKADGGQYPTFSLTFTGEELADNLSLREKVKRDFGLTLPEFDEDETSLADYFDAIETAIEKLPRWRMRRMMSLTLLSFTNMLLVRDLDPDKWPQNSSQSKLMGHPIVRRVFEGSPSEDDARYGDEYAIDEHKHAHLPLIYDADSSQHSALIDVLEGRNLVIEGPPGTGKSQTITNLIASALHAGKKVLFVAEKLAALEVVKARLAHAGLEHFILELHSNKTNKKRVLEDLAKRVAHRPQPPHGLTDLLESLESKRKELKAYADLLNGVHGNRQELTVHKVLWKAELYRQLTEDAGDAAQDLLYEPAPSTTASEFSALFDLLKYVAKQHDEIGSFDDKHPFWGFFQEVLQPGDDLRVQRILSDHAPQFDAFAQAMGNAAELLGGHKLNMSAESAERLLNVLANLAPTDPDEVAFDLLPHLFPSSDPMGAKSRVILKDLRSRLDELQRMQTLVASRWVRSEPASDETLRVIEEHEPLVGFLGVGHCTVADLQEKTGRLDAAIAAAAHAISELESMAKEVGIPFDGTAASITKIQAVLEEAASAPDDHLYLRHEDLRHSHAVAVLDKAHSDLTAILAQRASLNERLYLDVTPSEQVLKDAILVLREGDTWYRVFQGKWRKAVAVHRQLGRKKTKRKGEERLSELEELFQHGQRSHAWSHHEELRRFAGPHFQKEETPLEELVKLSSWVSEAVKRLEQAQVSNAVFDPLSIEPSRLAALRTATPIVERALTTLEELLSTLKNEFSGMESSVSARLTTETWPSRIRQAQKFSDGLSKVRRQLEASVASQVRVGEGIAAIRASHRIPRVEAELSGHREAQALLGARFDGTGTLLEPVEAAHTYGRLVQDTKLPSSIEAILISDSSLENHTKLSRFIADINQGWDTANGFANQLSALGTFELSKWVGGSDISHSEFVANLASKTRWAWESMDGLLPWVQYIQQREESRKRHLSPFISLLETGRVPPKHLANTFGHRFYASIAHSLFRTYPELSRFSGTRHSSVRAEFASLDNKLIKLRGQQVAAQCKQSANPPAGTGGARVDDKTEMELLRHLMPQQRPRLPVRKMLKQAGRAIQELKPCFMMGPQAVAQFLEPGRLEFDIIVMDEASQLKPEEAIGAIARGKQLVVVGDPKQLPPTSFFSRMNPADDGDGAAQVATDEGESILDVCIGHFQPIRSLRWHYRSRHESLIAFSNHYFYRGNLFVFPSPYPKGKSLGLRYTHVVDGVYENQMNKVEAVRVVNAVVDHILHRTEDSLGVVTLNIKQRDLIAELLDERLKSLPPADAFQSRWEAEGMGLFIKNLENVQGDERDCIIISTTFGKAKGTTVVRQNFGPISRDGGWRRLNVLFTRARKSVAVFSSMQPEDIVVDNSTPVGTKALRNYLEYARNGILPQDVDTGLDPDSDFEVAVIEILRANGFEVKPQLGVAGFRIDIAVKHPDYPSGYLAAIECDGATYHSGVSVRDRDRIRQEILESLGWKNRIWRIWSTDWFRNPRAEAQKMFAFLGSLRTQPVPPEFATIQEEPKARVRRAETALSIPDEADVDLLHEEDEDLEIEVGDLVTYVAANDSKAELLTVRLTTRNNDFSQGLVSEHTPLAQALLGATVGETVVLRVPGQPPRQFVIKEIKRLREGTTA